MREFFKNTILMILFTCTIYSVAFSSELFVNGRIYNELGIPIGSAEVTFTDSDVIKYSTSTDSF